MRGDPRKERTDIEIGMYAGGMQFQRQSRANEEEPTPDSEIAGSAGK